MVLHRHYEWDAQIGADNSLITLSGKLLLPMMSRAAAEDTVVSKEDGEPLTFSGDLVAGRGVAQRRDRGRVRHLDMIGSATAASTAPDACCVCNQYMEENERHGCVVCRGIGHYYSCGRTVCGGRGRPPAWRCNRCESPPETDDEEDSGLSLAADRATTSGSVINCN